MLPNKANKKVPNTFQQIYAGDQMVFFLLNVVEFIGLLMTFKPFLRVPSGE